MARNKRISHAVGTIPVDNLQEGLRLFPEMIDEAHAIWVPTEAGERRRWVINQIQHMQKSPALRNRNPLGVIDPPAWLNRIPLVNYALLPVYAGSDYGAYTPQLGYAQHAKDVLRLMQPRLGAQQRLQIGLPGPWQVPLFTGSLGLYQAFEDATVREAWKMTRFFREQGVEHTFQIDLPGENCLANLVSRFSDGKAEQLMDGMVARLRFFISRLPYGSRLAFHLCYGHKDGKPLVSPKSLDVTVRLAKKLDDMIAALNRLPSNPGYLLDYIHLPLCPETGVAPLLSSYYAPLGDWVMHQPDTYLALGLVTLHGVAEYHSQVLRRAEAFFPGNVAVSAPCGLGELPEPQVYNARKILEMQARLANEV